MSKITSRWDYEHGLSVLILEKSRGKLTLDSIEEHLRYSTCGKFHGNWAIILRCGEQTCGGSGWDDGREPKGDKVILYQLGEGEVCPVCTEFMPPEYCPSCGEKLPEHTG